MKHIKKLSAALILSLTGAAGAADRIIELSSGREISSAALLAQIRVSDYVLLGELHDNPHHHARRAELLAQLAAPAVVVAEHLPSPTRLLLQAELDPAPALSAAGFDLKAWRWPLHRPLFEAIAQAQLPVLGGNAPRELVRQVAREGGAALAAQLGGILAATPLDPAAQAQLESALLQGHCGQLSSTRMPAMVLAQGLRDASMWQTLQAAAAAGGQPAVLLAGNGHVRLDYGVGRFVRALQPQAKLISVGFAELGQPLPSREYTHVWISAAAERPDPCAGFAMPELGSGLAGAP